MVHQPTQESLANVFEDWTEGLNSGRIDDFYACFHEGSDILDEDHPRHMTKIELINHWQLLCWHQSVLAGRFTGVNQFRLGKGHSDAY
ncbi:hypothetical protein IG197_34510 (plasmid) [Aminobacter sp. SR38]|jgi:hypothetical protein|uniref:hypothetical protein n=1 Tax=Aminobacter sp. SR38 TaxID=2774562 RepID=UPI00178146EA|nr:hypothetical protein [Aminobacter sp. SR38]QOF75487.1 hypothetical protein IG197_34510 [Aminobacter sp. SR38]